MSALIGDLAHAIRTKRPHRASGELAYHVLEVMEAFQTSSERGKHVTIKSRPQRPAMLPQLRPLSNRSHDHRQSTTERSAHLTP